MEVILKLGRPAWLNLEKPNGCFSNSAFQIFGTSDCPDSEVGIVQAELVLLRPPFSRWKAHEGSSVPT